MKNEGFIFILALIFLFSGARSVITYIQYWNITWESNIGWLGFACTCMITAGSAAYVYLFIDKTVRKYNDRKH
jgi:hypothetical protein